MSPSNNKQQRDYILNSEAKLPPQVIEIEESVLGGIMLDKDAIGLVVEILNSDSFYKDSHKIIFKAMYNLYSKGEPIDIITVSQQLREQGDLEKVGGSVYVMQLTNRLTSGGNIEYHARVVKEKQIQRSLIKIGSKVVIDSYEDSNDVFDLIESTETDIFNLTKDIFSKSESAIGDLYFKKIKQIENRKEGHVEGYLTGIQAIDTMTMGIKKQELVILAARPGMGKTSLALTLASNMAVEQNIPVAFFSLEMGEMALTSRLMSFNSSIPLKFIINNNVTGTLFQKLMEDLPKIKNAPLFIDDQGSISINQLRSKVRRLINKNHIEFIFVDYLQKMRGDDNKKGNREQEINQIVSGLKNIAKEFDIPVMALSQLSREVEKRSDKAPQLSDLRESGSLEQEADLVIFTYRPGYYKLDVDSNGESIQEGETEIIFAKNRNGSLGANKMLFIKEYTKFIDIGSQEQQKYTSSQNINQYRPQNNITINNQSDSNPF